jgi:hypothetical protein
MKFVLLIIFFLFHQNLSFAQEDMAEEMQENELGVEGDIFSDFNEDLEASQVLEDERFYRYGRFFTVNLGLGYTTFTGNRGDAYRDNHPSFHLSLVYFLNFYSAITLGVEFSKHTMFIDTYTRSYSTFNLGAVETSFTRPFFGFKQYLDTSDLGTALTYSNPYFLGRVEYWYQKNKFIDRVDTLPAESGGGIGTGLGFGFEFPVELKKAYIGVEYLYHVVNFFDKFTQDYQQIPGNANSTYGYTNLAGNVHSVMITYNFTW